MLFIQPGSFSTEPSCVLEDLWSERSSLVEDVVMWRLVEEVQGRIRPFGNDVVSQLFVTLHRNDVDAHIQGLRQGQDVHVITLHCHHLHFLKRGSHFITYTVDRDFRLSVDCSNTISNLLAVDFKIRRFDKVTEEVCVVLEVGWCEQPEILNHFIRDGLIIEEFEQSVFLLISQTPLHNINNLQ